MICLLSRDGRLRVNVLQHFGVQVVVCALQQEHVGRTAVEHVRAFVQIVDRRIRLMLMLLLLWWWRRWRRLRGRRLWSSVRFRWPDRLQMLLLLLLVVVLLRKRIDAHRFSVGHVAQGQVQERRVRPLRERRRFQPGRLTDVTVTGHVHVRLRR